jgi:hypothetical protein
MKTLIAIAFIGILLALGFAGVFMMRGGAPGQSAAKQSRMFKALAVRVGLSVLVFLSVMLAYWLGYITPTGIPVGR